MKPDFDEILAGFPRRVPVFPLPEVVLFPSALLPLHVFEPRYRRMLDDALASDRLLALALLKQCEADEYEEQPPFHETVCVGWIAHHEPLEDGRSNIALLGVAAGRATPCGGDEPYRTAEVELLEDTFDPDAGYEAKLAHAYGQSFGGDADFAGLREQLARYLEPDQMSAALVNTCALAAPLFPLDKLRLLEERSLTRRLDRLIELLTRPWQWN